MSRIGRKPIPIPAGVTVAPKGTIRTPVPPGIRFRLQDGMLLAEREDKEAKALHGLARALAANAVRGVTEGYTRELDIVGIGYKAEVQGRRIIFSLGYSHPIEFPLPEGIEVRVERRNKPIPEYQMTLTVSGIDKQLVGQIAANIRSLRRPDAYKGKGIRYADEVLRLKPGKTGK
jgi:large subunit ribosomal protein L6